MQICLRTTQTVNDILQRLFSVFVSSPVNWKKKITAWFPNSLVKRLLSCLWSPRRPSGVTYLISTGDCCLKFATTHRHFQPLHFCMASQKLCDLLPRLFPALVHRMLTASTLCQDLTWLRPAWMWRFLAEIPILM